MVQRAMIDGAATTSVQAAFYYARAALDREHPNRTLFQLDATAGPLDLRQGADPADHRPPQSTPPRPHAPAKPDQPDSDDDAEPSGDGCAALTLGVVRCRD